MGYLTAEQIAAYHRDGYVALPRLVDMERVQALRRLTEDFVERSRALDASEGAFDFVQRHGGDACIVTEPSEGRLRWWGGQAHGEECVAHLDGLHRWFERVTDS